MYKNNPCVIGVITSLCTNICFTIKGEENYYTKNRIEVNYIYKKGRTENWWLTRTPREGGPTMDTPEGIRSELDYSPMSIGMMVDLLRAVNGSFENFENFNLLGA